MLRAKIKDLLEDMETNKDYYCYQVPEEYHMWTVKHKWKPMIESFGVIPLRLKVRGVGEDCSNEILRYSHANPLVVCGVSIKGHETASSSKTYGWDMRVDSVSEINEVLSELCSKNNVEVVQVKELDVYNKNMGVELRAEVHNPDGNGSSLYIVGFVIDNNLVLYPKISISSMAKYVGEFQGDFAQCCVMDGRTHGCVIKNKIKKTQMKKR